MSKNGSALPCNQFSTDEIPYSRIPALHSAFLPTLSVCATSRARAQNYFKGCALTPLSQDTFQRFNGISYRSVSLRIGLHPRWRHNLAGGALQQMLLAHRKDGGQGRS